ncbi:MAG TPA: hypothetical protein VGN72_02515 [Tepidisphaeraceae bacterium]|jgi:hypothetical protein|nr:hypothetical protein [Tepidisphaeraceae bacterium]
MTSRSGSKRFADLPDSDAACIGCGYCLRGQTLDGRCPECGTVVAMSAAKAADEYAGMLAVGGQNDERRRSDLRWGPWLIIVAIVIEGIARMLPEGPATLVLRSALRVAACILAASGVYASTRSAVGLNQPRYANAVRRLLRVIVLAGVVGTLLKVAGIGPSYGQFAYIIPLLTPYVLLVGSLLFYVYAISVARACRQTAAVTSCAIVLVLLLGSMVFRAHDISQILGAWGWINFASPYDPMAHFPIVGSGFAPAGDLQRWSQVPANPKPAASVASMVLERLSAAVVTLVRSDAAGWFSLIALLQLAFMSGRPNLAGSAGNSEASSPP